MTDHTTAAQAADINPLSDEYVNAVIQRHGYQSPEAVCARLYQWIGLHGGENGLTLLMYEAHKALSKLRAPVSDIRKGFELTYAADADDPACASDLSHFTNGWRACIMSQVRAPVADERQGDIAAGLQDSAYCAGLQRGFMLGNHNDNDGLRQALESRDGYVKTIKDARDALASAPVAGEAEIMAIVRDQCPDFDAAHEGPSEDDMISIARTLLARYAAPRASEAVPIGLLATEHTGMRVDYSGLLKQARSALEHGETEPALAEMLRQLAGHLEELGQRWYAGDVAVVDELLQLYCVESEVRAALSAQPGAQE